MPTPFGVIRQFGDNGTNPEQCGHGMVRASRAVFEHMAGMIFVNSVFILVVNKAQRSLNSSNSLSPNMAGHAIVAYNTNVATGLMSLATATNPSLSDSRGILPPPAVGSTINTVSRSRPISLAIQSRSALFGVYVNALLYPYGFESLFFSLLACSIFWRVLTGSPCMPST